MGFTRAFIALLISSIVVDARPQQQYKHEAEEVIVRRQVGLPVQVIRTPSPAASPAAAVTSQAAIAYITPSPGASPVAITEQSQLVSSYVAEFTLCELPPLAFFPITPLTPLPSTTPSTARYQNYSISTPPGNGSCTTIYSPTQTMVCTTTLTGLVEKYTVSNCAQDITFSSEYGYVLASSTAASNVTPGVAGTGIAVITPAPTVQRLTTYYLAPWQAVTAGTAPDEVTLKVCATYANGTEECVHQYEVWHTSLLTQVATTTTSVNISTTVHGLSKIIVETFAANITDKVTTFTMTTDMALEYSTEIITTSRGSKPKSTMTITVEEASDRTGSTTTRTSTLHRTISTTVYVGTSTATLLSAVAAVSSVAVVTAEAAAVSSLLAITSEDDTALPTPTESVNFVSLSGIATAK